MAFFVANLRSGVKINQISLNTEPLDWVSFIIDKGIFPQGCILLIRCNCQIRDFIRSPIGILSIVCIKMKKLLILSLILIEE